MAGDLRDQLQRTLGGAYTLERELGGGGMSRVFVATELALGRRVVIKVLAPDLAAQVSVDRFKREIALAAQLQQAHIVPLLSAGDTGELPYYTMPFVEGESLRARIAREGELPIAEAVGILKEVARALSYAHQRGVVHRDIKPDNVLLSGGSAMVTDFGVAKALGASTSPGGSNLTSLGVALGTPAYMAPEQASADPMVDHRADIYAFGAMAYELLTGHPPFGGRPPQATLAAHIRETPEAVDKLRPAVPPLLAQLVMRCLEKRPADRQQSASELAQVLEIIVTPGSGMLPAAVATSSMRATVWSRPALTIAVAGAIIVVGAVLVIWQPGASPPEASKSIAVLPFRDPAAKKEDEFFSAGITTEITDALARIPGLRVPAPTLTRATVEKHSDFKELGAALNVASLLEGDVQRSGERMRISARLVNARTGAEEWSKSYTLVFKDIFAVQDSMAHAIVSAVGVRLASRGDKQLVRAATTSPEAHALYLEGLYQWNRRTYTNLQQAITLFERAIAKDPQYARAHAGVAMSYAVIPTFADVNNDAVWARAIDAAHAALRIDSTAAEAHAALGFASMGMFRYATAERYLRAAIRFDPNLATAHGWLGQLLITMGRADEAIAEGRAARALDPTSRTIRTQLFGVYFRSGRLAAADSVLQDLLSFDPDYANTYRSVTNLRLVQGRTAEAVASAQKTIQIAGSRLSVPLAQLGAAYAANGETAKARSIYRELVDRSKSAPVSGIGLALLSDALGDREQALRYLEQSVAQHDVWYNWTHSPVIAKLQSDPRAAAIIARAERGVEGERP